VHPLVSHRVEIDKQAELVFCVELRGVHVAGQVIVRVIFPKMPDYFVPHVQGLNAFVVDLVGDAIHANFHAGNVRVEKRLRVSRARSVGLAEEKKNPLHGAAEFIDGFVNDRVVFLID